jgi:hypothetical protein
MTEASAKSTAAAVDDKPGKSTKAPKSPATGPAKAPRSTPKGNAAAGDSAARKARAARTRLEAAQRRYDAVSADNARLVETTAWLSAAADRAQRLQRYYEGRWLDDVDAVLALDPHAVTPPVANQDSIWEALAERDEQLRRLLVAIATDLAPVSHP